MSAMRLSGDCPKCGAALVRRTRRRDGNPFLSCSGYPACSFAEDYDPHLNEIADELEQLKARVRVLERQARGQSAPRTSSASGIDISRALRDVIAAAHPDRWPGSPELAHLVAAQLNALRSKL